MSTQEFAPFWMVYGIGQGAPTVRHATETKALSEAQRLAKSNPDVKFCVMCSMFVVESKTVSVKKIISGSFVEIDDISF